MDFHPSLPEYKIVMFGDSGVGKTSLVEQFSTNGISPDIQPTVGAAYTRCPRTLPFGTVVMSIWDTAGQERYRSLVPLYMRTADGMVLVVDVSRPRPCDALATMWSSVENEAPVSLHLILAANKIDLVPDDYDFSEVNEWATAHGVEWMKTSAKTGTGVHELFDTLADRLCSPEVRARIQADLELRASAVVASSKSNCC
jgi:small GTP-binding protein